MPQPDPTQAALAIYLVTGSRDWDGDPGLIAKSLQEFANRNQGRRLVLYHGDCPGRRSVDQLAADRAEQLGYKVVPFPADWYRGGTLKKPDRRAGPDRNRQMVSAAAARAQVGAIVEVHGWPMPGSTGTHNCLQAAAAAGLGGVIHRTRHPSTRS